MTSKVHSRASCSSPSHSTPADADDPESASKPYRGRERRIPPPVNCRPCPVAHSTGARHRLPSCLFAGSCFVEQEHAVGMPARQSVRITGQLILNRLVVPGGLAHQIRQSLLVYFVLNLGHLRHVSPRGLDEPAQEVEGRPEYRARTAREQRTVPFGKSAQSRIKALEPRQNEPGRGNRGVS